MTLAHVARMYKNAKKKIAEMIIEPVSGENRPLITDEPFDSQNMRKFSDQCYRIFRIYLKLIKEK